MAPSAAEMFDRFHLAVYRYFRRVLADPDAAEDLTQEVFLRVVRGLPAYQSIGKEGGWVFGIARNVLADAGRSRRLEATGGLDLDQLAGVEPRQVLAFDLDEAVRFLAAKDRHVFLLREVAGLSYSEIAEACGVTEESVRARLRRSRLGLRARLSGRLTAGRVTRRP
jgi:RNA polymerase sigma-70 factor, ECF subfamily